MRTPGAAPLVGGEDAMVTGSTSGIVAVVGGGEEVWEMGKGKVEIRVSCLGMDGWIHVARARWGGP